MTPQVAPDIKELRSRELIALGEALSDAFREQFLGQTLSVLFERELEADAAQVVSSLRTGGEYGDDTHLFEGLSSNYLRVCSFTPVNWRGKMGNVRIEKKFRGYLQGTLLEK